LCQSLNRPPALFCTLIGQWRHSLQTDTLTATMQIAQRAYALAQEQRNSAMLVGAYRVLALPLYFAGEFDARQYAKRGLEIWRSGDARFSAEEVNSPVVVCLWIEALSGWHLGEVTACRATLTEAIPWRRS
jgi:hypothetical protein